MTGVGGATQPSSYLIETHQLRRVYTIGAREVPALRGVDLQVEAGKFVVLQGRSGSGKTTLLNCVGGLDQPTSGQVRVFGRDLSSLREEERMRWRRGRLGFIFQSFGLLPTLTAYENVELMQRLAGRDRRQRRQRTLECLALVGLSRWHRHRPFELSGGQQQRLSIARALANQPELILADEPTGELDSATAREVLALFRRIVDEHQVTLLTASHDTLAGEYADVILRLEDGQIVGRQ